MLLARLLLFGVLPVLLSKAQCTSDHCSKVAGKDFVDPLDAEACLASFPFNDTLKDNVLSIVSGSLDFYTWEAQYLDLPPPFHEESWDIRAQIKRINQTRYETDYQFNRELYEAVNRLHDGHTFYQTHCYLTYLYFIPTPIVLLDTGIHIAPNIAELFGQYGANFTSFYEKKGFDWKRLAGAEVHRIGGLPAWEYVDYIADKVAGTYLDHNVRVNSAFSSYMMLGSGHTQRLGFVASRNFLMETSLEFCVVHANSTSQKLECVTVPFIASYSGAPFEDKESYWANNCLATNATNGVKLDSSRNATHRTRTAKAVPLIHPKMTADTPQSLELSLSENSTSAPSDVTSHILPGNETGGLFIGSFNGDSGVFQSYIHDTVEKFKEWGVKNIVIDVTNNIGGFLCEGMFLHWYLAGTNSGFPGFQTTSRANPLAQKLVKSEIAIDYWGNYSPKNYQFVNGTPLPDNFDYNDPPIPFSINDQSQPTSQRFEDSCDPPVVTMPENPPFDPRRIIIIGNGNCASTCALFVTSMRQKQNISIATFGGHPNHPIEYQGVAGNEILGWVDLDSEIKSAGLKNDFPQEFIVNASIYINWRTAYSWHNLETPVVFESDPSSIRLNYTRDTYNDPQKTWLYVEKHLFQEDKDTTLVN